MKNIYKLLLFFAVIGFITISCSKDEEPQPPFASFLVNPEEGFVGTVFTFNASDSYNVNEDCSELKYKWDFDGDGNWDTEYSDDATENHTYSKAGEYEPTLEIMDCQGWTNFVSKSLIVADTTSP